MQHFTFHHLIKFLLLVDLVLGYAMLSILFGEVGHFLQHTRMKFKPGIDNRDGISREITFRCGEWISNIKGYIVIERLDKGAFSDAIVFETSTDALVLGSNVVVRVDHCSSTISISIHHVIIGRHLPSISKANAEVGMDVVAMQWPIIYSHSGSVKCGCIEKYRYVIRKIFLSRGN